MEIDGSDLKDIYRLGTVCTVIIKLACALEFCNSASITDQDIKQRRSILWGKNGMFICMKMRIFIQINMLFYTKKSASGESMLFIHLKTKERPLVANFVRIFSMNSVLSLLLFCGSQWRYSETFHGRWVIGNLTNENAVPACICAVQTLVQPPSYNLQVLFDGCLVASTTPSKTAMVILWLYRYRLYRANQHRTGTDNYRYSNGQRTAVQSVLALLGDKWLSIQDR